MVGASLLSLLHTIAQFNGDMSTMLAPLGEYESVGDYLRDREIAPQLKEATTTWCSLAQVGFTDDTTTFVLCLSNKIYYILWSGYNLPQFWQQTNEYHCFYIN